MAAVLSASTIAGEQVVNLEGEDLGKVEEVMIDVQAGRVSYAVVSFGSGFMHSGKLFAIPWGALALDQHDKKLILNVPREILETAEGFDKDRWPDMQEPSFHTRTYSHFGLEPWLSNGDAPNIMIEAAATSAGSLPQRAGEG